VAVAATHSGMLVASLVASTKLPVLYVKLG